MKTIILALLFPCVCNAQKMPTIEQIEKSIVKEKADTPIRFWSSWSIHKGITKVIDNINGKNKTLAEIDTAGHLKVYGDTLSVLKAIFKSYNVEIKD
jgi:hypothetical protein